MAGLDAVDTVVTLLRRSRGADPLHGLWEAADFCWWWRVERPTDTHPQLVWFEDDVPMAAVVATQWGDRTGLDPLTLPGADEDVVAQVVQRGVEHAVAHGMTDLDVRTDVADAPLHRVLEGLGFVADPDGDADVEGWIDVTDRPPVSVLLDGHRLVDRTVTAATGVEHHFVPRGGDAVERRLRQTPLYRADLDLVVLDAADLPVAYGLCWFDPVTRTGLVEPMRTEDGHEGRGLARHVLTAGLERLADAGAESVKIAWLLDNPVTRHLYPDVGFVPTRSTVMFRR